MEVRRIVLVTLDVPRFSETPLTRFPGALNTS